MLIDDDEATVIAFVLYAALRAYELGRTNEGVQFPGWEDAEPRTRIEVKTLVLTAAKLGPTATPRALHEAIVNEWAADGWVPGFVFNEREKTNPGLRPWDEAPESVKVERYLTCELVLAIRRINEVERENDQTPAHR